MNRLACALLVLTSWPAGAASFVATGSMARARIDHTSTVLPDGSVLVAGGFSSANGSGGALASTEIYDPVPGTFTALPPMTAARAGHSATLLSDGRVLLAGGDGGKSAEVFDPRARTFTATPGSMVVSRSSHTATLLDDGRVLLTGTFSLQGSETAEIFDPRTGRFTSVASTMSHGRALHGAARLTGGRVLVAGGCAPWIWSCDSSWSAEIFEAGAFRPLDSRLAAARAPVQMVAVAPAAVLVTGSSPCGGLPRSADLFDPGSETFTTRTPSSYRSEHTATLMRDGRVLLAGGFDRCSTQDPTGTAELFDPVVDAFLPVAATLVTPRSSQAASALPDGRVLLSGGHTAGSGSVTASAELFVPDGWTAAAAAAIPMLPALSGVAFATLLASAAIPMLRR